MNEVNSRVEKLHNYFSRINTIESLELIGDVIESTKLSILIINKKNNIYCCNSAAALLFGYEKEEIVNSNISKIFSQIRVQDRDTKIFGEKFKNDQVIENLDALVRKQNSEVVWINFTLHPILNHRGEVIARYFIGSDLTELEKIEKDPIFFYKKFKSLYRPNKYKTTNSNVISNGQLSNQHNSENKYHESNLYQLLEFETLITSISSKFVGTIDFDIAINDSMRNIGVSKNLSRVYLFLFDEKKKYMTNTNEWCNTGIKPHVEYYIMTPISEFPEAMKHILQGNYISIEDSSDLTKGAINLKKILLNHNIKATLAYPIYIHNKIAGFIGFDDEESPRFWNSDDYSLLRITSQIIGNVLERKVTEQKLIDSEERHRLISEGTDDLIILYNENLTVDYLNENAHKRALGYPSHLYWKQTFRNSIVYKDDLNRSAPIIKEGYVKGSYKFQIRLRHVEGHYLWFEITGKVFYDKNGIKKLLVVGRDITDIKNAEQKIKDSEEKYRNILESIKEGYYEVDLKGNFTFINDSICEITKAPKNEIIGSNFSKFCDIKTKEYLKRELKDLYNQGTGFKILEYQQVDKNRRKSYLESSIYLKYDSNDKTIGFKGVIRDISERKKAEVLQKKFNHKLEEEVELRTIELAEALEKQRLYLDQILKSSQFKTDFLASMSHELRTPLNAIIGFADLLLEGHYGTLNEVQREFINDIKSSAEHQFEMISHILDISKIESGKSSLSIEAFRPINLVENLVSTLRPLIQEKNLKFEIRGFKIYKIVRADRLKVKQIIYNLISNAIKFTEKGSILVEFSDSKKDWEIKVTDTGIGIAKDDFDIIFKDFKRVKSKYVDSVPGSGLGLALTKRIIELHGGQIKFESILGKGSSFSFTIPKKNRINSQVLSTGSLLESL